MTRNTAGVVSERLATYDPQEKAKPACPKCGWRNTRPSYTKNLLDNVLRLFEIRAYRCRSCGTRFRKRLNWAA